MSSEQEKQSDNGNGFYRDQYFDQLNLTIGEFRKDIKKLSEQVTWLRAQSALISAAVSLVGTFLLNYLNKGK